MSGSHCTCTQLIALTVTLCTLRSPPLYVRGFRVQTLQQIYILSLCYLASGYNVKCWHYIYINEYKRIVLDFNLKLCQDMSDTDRLWVKTKHLLLAILPAVHFTDKQTLIGE